MYQRILLLCMVLPLFYSCKKEATSGGKETTSVTIQDATLISSANLFFTSKNNTGTASIYQQKNSKYLLSLQQMQVSGDRSIAVYISSTPTFSSSSIKISSFRNLTEDLLRELPNGLDLTLFKYVLILAEPSEEVIASGELSS